MRDLGLPPDRNGRWCEIAIANTPCAAQRRARWQIGTNSNGQIETLEYGATVVRLSDVRKK